MPGQTSYAQAASQGRPGQPNDPPERVLSGNADETIKAGLVVMSGRTDRNKAKLPRATQCVILDDAGAYTSGTAVVTINGVTVSVTYDTNKATTMAAIATALQALSFVLTATYAGGSNTITIIMQPDVDIYGVTATGFVGGMTITSYTYTTADVLLGLALFDSKLPYGTARRTGLQDQAVLTLSGDVLNTSDTVDGFIFGVAIDTVTYATSEAVTLQLVANAIQEIPGIVLAVVNTTNRTITVTARPGKDLTATLTVTDNALASVAPSFATVLSVQAMPISESEQAYLPGETVGIVRRSLVWMRCEEAIVVTDSVFVRVAVTAANTEIGGVRNDVDSGTCQAFTSLTFYGPSTTDPDGNRIVLVEINQP